MTNVKSQHRSILLSDYMSQVVATDEFSSGRFTADSPGDIWRGRKHHGLCEEISPREGCLCRVSSRGGGGIWRRAVVFHSPLPQAQRSRRRNFCVGRQRHRLCRRWSLLTHSCHRKSLYPMSPHLLAAPDLFDPALFELGEAAASLLGLRGEITDATARLAIFANCYLRALKAARVTFAEVVHKKSGG